MIKTILRSPIASVVLFALAAVLLVGGSVGAAQAAPRLVSNDYRAEVVLSNIETAITENGTIVEGDDTLLGVESFRTPNGIGADGSGFKIGKTYDDVLAVRNVGTIDQYVRVTVNKYWVLTDEAGNPLSDASGKVVTLDPSLIDLHFVEGDGWTIDKDASTSERTVLYYADAVAPGADTTPFADKITIKSDVVTSVTKLANGGLSLDYEGVQFRVKASVDAVQTHNGEDAMTGAWGRTNK